MLWSEFARKPGAALDRVGRGETITITKRPKSMWCAQVRPLRHGEAETSGREIWRCSDIGAHPDAAWVAIKRAPILLSRRGKVVAVLEVMP